MEIKQQDMAEFNEHECYYNSYLVLSSKKTYKEILENDKGASFIFNPTKPYIPLEDDAYDMVIEYFSKLEEYEICADLVKAKELAKLMVIM
jgi:hypothetical protein